MGEVEPIKGGGIVASKARSLIEVACAPVEAASRVMTCCRQADGAARLVQHWRRGAGHVLPFRAENVPIAIALRAALPAEDAVRAAHDAMAGALAEPSDAGFTESAVASLLDGLGRKPNASAVQLLAAFAEVAGDDEAGEVFELYQVLSAPPVTVAFAVRRLRRKQIFAPTPAEFADACALVHGKLGEGLDELFGYLALWENVLDIIEAHAPRMSEAPENDACPF